MKSEEKPISVGYWMLAVLVIWIPIVNLIWVPVCAFFGKNESKKNFYKALLIWVALTLAVHVAIILTLGWPEIAEFIKSLTSTNQSR